MLVSRNCSLLLNFSIICALRTNDGTKDRKTTLLVRSFFVHIYHSPYHIVWKSDNLHTQSTEIGSNIIVCQEKLVILHSDWGNSFQDIEILRRYALILYVRSLRNFKKVNKRGRNGLHAYAWGCYSHIYSQRFSQGLYIRKCGIQFHAFAINSKGLSGTGKMLGNNNEKTTFCF